MAVSVVGQQAALVTSRQLWQSTAPPQLLWCGCFPEVLLALGQMMKVRRQAVVGWLCPSSMAAPAGASTQSLPTLSGVSSRCRDLHMPLQSVWSAQRKLYSFPLTCCVASAWAYTGSGPGMLTICLQSEGLRSSWFTILGIQFPFWTPYCKARKDRPCPEMGRMARLEPHSSVLWWKTGLGFHVFYMLKIFV